MKLGLLGFPVEHSLSPSLYKKLLGSELTSYELFSCKTSKEIPHLEEFKTKLNGLNITSPYKTHFVDQVTITDHVVKELGVINTLSFVGDEVFATNTDYVAVVDILKTYLRQWPHLSIELLGSGSMAKLTQLVARQLSIPYKQYSRKTHPQLSTLDLSQPDNGVQSLVINACSRDFVFQGKLSPHSIFWDYNYDFYPHKTYIPTQVKQYDDGKEMLELQAQAAIMFWRSTSAKLK